MTLTSTDIRTRAAAALAAQRAEEAAAAEDEYQSQLAHEEAIFQTRVDRLVEALAAFGLACPREKVARSVFEAFHGAMIAHGDVTYFYTDSATFHIGTRCEACKQWQLSDSLEPGNWAALGSAFEAEEECNCRFAAYYIEAEALIANAPDQEYALPY